jgi:hypothetical protein
MHMATKSENPASEAARLLGSMTSSRKKRTSKANGKLGGRPKGSKDSYQRTRGESKHEQ